MQTLHAGCNKAEPKFFALPQTPFPGAQDGQNLISWRWSLLSPTDPVWWRSMYAISSYRGNTPTNIQTHTHPQTGPITVHRAAASTQCKLFVTRWCHSTTYLTSSANRQQRQTTKLCRLLSCLFVCLLEV